MTYLIVNADDFGLHTEVNHGILKGHREGIITSTSLVASGEAFTEAVDMARECPKLGIGIHFTLVGGIAPVLPASEVPTLVDENGLFPKTYGEVVARIVRKQISYTEVHRELAAQRDAILATGLTVTHVDGHQHLHMLPSVLPIAIAVAMEKDIHKMRLPAEALTFKNGVAGVKRWAAKCALTEVARRGSGLMNTFGISHPTHFWGMINGGHLDGEALLGILMKVAMEDGVHEIMCHPGRNAQILGQRFDWGYSWDQELAALTDPALSQFLKDTDVKLVNYGDLI